MVHASRGRLAPASPQLRSEVAIITELGRRLFGDDLGWREMGEDYSLIRKHIEHVVPGFDAYEERVSQPGGFMLPRPPRGSRTFETETGKAHFTVNPPTAVEVPDAHLLLQTVRSHDQFNTTISRSTASTTATAASKAAGTSSSSTAPTCATAGCTTGTCRHRQRAGRRRAARQKLPRRAVPHTTRLRRRPLPRSERPRPAGLHRRGQPHPTSKSIIIRLEPAS